MVSARGSAVTPTKTVLLLDGLDTNMGPVDQRLRKLGFQPLRAKTPQEAFQIAEDRRGHIGAIVVPPDLVVVDLRAAIADLCSTASEDGVDCIALGPRPPGRIVDELRAAGVARALWQPFGDGPLRFHLNRALAESGPGGSRAELRVPARVPVRVWLSGRHKPAKTYTLAASGAFLETGRPSLRGARLGIQMQMETGEIELEARVVYPNVPGNFQKWNLPLGMAVEFITVADQDEARIRSCVTQTALQFQL